MFIVKSTGEGSRDACMKATIIASTGDLCRCYKNAVGSSGGSIQFPLWSTQLRFDGDFSPSPIKHVRYLFLLLDKS